MFAERCTDGFVQQIKAPLARPAASDVFSVLRVRTRLLRGREDSWPPPVQHEEKLQLAGTVA